MNDLEIPNIDDTDISEDLSKDHICQECGSIMRRFFEEGRFIYICGGCGNTESE